MEGRLLGEDPASEVVARTPKPPNPERERKRREWQEREARKRAAIQPIRVALHVEDLALAATLAAAYRVETGAQGLGWDFRNGMPATCIAAAAAHLANTHEALVGSAERKRALAVELALDALLGTGDATEAERVSAGLRCPDVELFLQQPPCSRFVASFKDRPLALYIHEQKMRMGTQRQSCDALQDGGAMLFRVLTSGEPCSICDAWAARGLLKTDELPAIPLHYGCRCMVLTEPQ